MWEHPELGAEYGETDTPGPAEPVRDKKLLALERQTQNLQAVDVQKQVVLLLREVGKVKWNEPRKLKGNHQLNGFFWSLEMRLPLNKNHHLGWV